MKQKSMAGSLAGILIMTAAIAFLALLLVLSFLRGIGWTTAVWLVGFAVMMLIRTPYTLSNRNNHIVEAPKRLVEKLLLTGMLVATNVLPFIYIGTGIFDFANYRLPPIAAWLGTIAQVPFLLLFWRSHADLKLNWSVSLEIRAGHELISSGIYSRIRHPMYAAIWIWVLAQPLLLQNWIAGSLGVPAFAAMWFIRVPQEEAMMRRTFGDAYEHYVSSTGRLFPKLKQP